MLTDPDRFERHRRVQKGRGGNIADIDLGLIEHIAVVGLDVPDAILIGKAESPRLVYIANGHDHAVRVADLVLEVRGHKTSPRPDHPYAQRFYSL